MQTLTPEQFKARYGTAGVEAVNNPEKKTLGTKAKEVGTGFVKGAAQTAIGTARILQEAGQGAIAAVDPTRTYNQVKEQTGFQSLKGKDAEMIDKQLASKSGYETAGKALEFAAELFFPVGKAEEIANITNKGGKFVGAELNNIGSRISSLSDNAVEGGTQIKEKLTDMLVNLDDKTKTALSRTPKEKFQQVVQQGKDALLDDKNRTPLESVGDSIVDGLKQVKQRASSIGQEKANYLNQAKVGLKPAGNIVKDAVLQLQKTFNGAKLDSSDSKLVKEVFDSLKSIMKNPRVQDVDKTIDFIQEKLYKVGSGDVVQVTDRVIGPLRKIVGELNGKVGKVAGKSYQKYNKEYSRLTGLVLELNKRVGKEGATAASFVKRLFSPSDARTKELFTELEKLTGQDYFRDARLAKFIMETLGDTRAASLLEQIPTSTSGAIGKAINYGVKKLSDPIKAAERFIEKNVK